MRKSGLLIALPTILFGLGQGYLSAESIAGELAAGANNSGVASSPRAVPEAFVEHAIPIEVTSRIARRVIRSGDPIPLEITIKNGLSRTVECRSFDLQLSDWNGETSSIALFDIYRGTRPEGLFLGRPEVDPPTTIRSMPWHPIRSGQSLSLSTDVRKWTIADGWQPGGYRMALRVDNLQVDGTTALSVLGPPIEFEIIN